MKLNIYMKSGNRITVSNVKDYIISNRGDEIVRFEIKYKTFGFSGEKLLVKTINLQQIEAVTRF